jgi:hypothetical protein
MQEFYLLVVFYVALHRDKRRKCHGFVIVLSLTRFIVLVQELDKIEYGRKSRCKCCFTSCRISQAA